jgi:hypothetical protein
VKVGTVAKGTETQRLGRAAAVGCGERPSLVGSVLKMAGCDRAVLQVVVLATIDRLLLSLVANGTSVVVDV